MVYACIYDNIPDKGGYGIHARSKGFPYGFEEDVLAVSGIFRAGSGYEENTAIRYAPLRNGKYLLTWVLRHPVTYVDGNRAWHTEVHFIMDAQEADKLFRYPISEIALRVERKARQMWQAMDCELDGGMQLFAQEEQPRDNLDANGRIEDCILLAGAFYCGQAGGANQMFLESEDPWGEMDMLQRCLPYGLRKELSFCIGLQNQQESKGTVFNLPTHINLQQLHSAQGEGAPMSQKYWHWETLADQELCQNCNRILDRMSDCSEVLLDMLFSVITNWNQLKAFGEEKLEDALGSVIMHTGQEIWCGLLRSRQYREQDLEQLLNLIKGNRNTKTLQKEINRRLRDPISKGKFADRMSGGHMQEHLLKQFLKNYAIRGAAIAAMVVVLIVFFTLLRQILVCDTVMTEQVIYYCVSREAALDTMKLIGAFACGAVSFWAVSRLIGTFKRKK